MLLIVVLKSETRYLPMSQSRATILHHPAKGNRGIHVSFYPASVSPLPFGSGSFSHTFAFFHLHYYQYFIKWKFYKRYSVINHFQFYDDERNAARADWTGTEEGRWIGFMSVWAASWYFFFSVLPFRAVWSSCGDDYDDDGDGYVDDSGFDTGLVSMVALIFFKKRCP